MTQEKISGTQQLTAVNNAVFLQGLSSLTSFEVPFIIGTMFGRGRKRNTVEDEKSSKKLKGEQSALTENQFATADSSTVRKEGTDFISVEVRPPKFEVVSAFYGKPLSIGGNHNAKIPKLFYQPKKLVGFDLDGGYITKDVSKVDTHVKLLTFAQWDPKKQQKNFLDWILHNHYFQNVDLLNKTYFVCFSRRLQTVLKTPFTTLPQNRRKNPAWQMFAVNFNNCIYLWDDDTDLEKQIPLNNKASYYGLHFEHICTHADPLESYVDESSKVRVVKEISFGKHQLLCLCGIDALDESLPVRGGTKEFEIKIHQAESYEERRAKCLRYWAQCAVQCVDNLVIGSRKGSTVTDVKMTTVDQMVKDCGATYETHISCEFLDRLLTEIWKSLKNHDVNETEEIRIKKLWWDCIGGKSSPLPVQSITLSDGEAKEKLNDILPLYYRTKLLTKLQQKVQEDGDNDEEYDGNDGDYSDDKCIIA